MRVGIICLVLFSSMTFGQNLLQTPPLNGVEVIGHGQVDLQAATYLLNIIINERGASAVKTAQSAEYKVKLIKQFIEKHSKTIKVASTAPLALKVSYPSLNNTIADVELFTRLPNKLPAKINTKLNQKQMHSDLAAAVIEANQRMVVNVSNINSYQRLIDLLIKVGVSDVQPLGISHQSYQILYQRALNNALADAKFKAKKMVNHLNITLGNVIAVQELDVHRDELAYTADSAEKHSVNGHPIEQQVVNARVKVQFAIKPQ